MVKISNKNLNAINIKVLIVAGAEGLEPSRTVLETAMLPLHHAPKAVAHASVVIIALPVGDVNPDYSMVYYTYSMSGRLPKGYANSKF